jgi:trimeric autotransporter adhesin
MKKILSLSFGLLLFTISTYGQFPNLVASSNAPICTGSTLSLQATHDTPPSGTTVDYSWQGPNAFSSTVQNPQITNVSSLGGTYTVTATFTGNYVGTHTATTSVIISALPGLGARAYLQNDINNSTSNFCIGNDMTLEASTNILTGVSYSWQGPNGFTSNIQTPTINNITTANAGTYIVTANYSYGNCVSLLKRQIEITVGSAKVSLSSNSVCAGGDVTITPTLLPSSASVNSYLWEGPNNFTSNANSLTINNLQERKTYKLTVQFGGSCAGTAIAYRTIAPSTPNPNVSYSALNCDVTIQASLSTPFLLNNYSWTGPNGYSSSSLINQISTAGEYTFTGTVTGSGCNDVFTRTIVVPRIPSSTNPVVSIVVFGSNEFGDSQGAFCTGSNINLSSFVAGDRISQLTYNWTGPNGFSSTAAVPLISNFDASKVGVYSLVVTGTGNACSPTSTFTISNTMLLIENPFPTITISRVNSANSSTICAGNTVNFSVNTFTNSGNSVGTYSWSGPNGFTSNLRNPTIENVSSANEGVYTVTATFTSGCVGTHTATSNLTISTNPSLGISLRRLKFGQNSATDCLGANVELIPTTTGIINSISWSGPNGFTSNDINPKIMGTSALQSGAYFATANVGGECPATITTNGTFTFSSNNLVFGINRENTNSTGDNRMFCEGSNLKLVVIPNTSFYYQGTYSWSGPNGFSSTEIAPTLNNITSANVGTYTLTVNYSDGCAGTATTTIPLNFTPPTISISKTYDTGLYNTVCTGGAVRLAPNNTTSVDTYSWVGPNGFTSNERVIYIPSVSITNQGTYTLTTTIGGNCTATVTSTASITLGDSPPISSFIVFQLQNTNFSGSTHCLGSSIVLLTFVNSQGTLTPNSYNWAGPNGFSSTLANPILMNTTSANAGVYTVTVAYTQQCGTVGTYTATSNLSFTRQVFIGSRKQGTTNSSSFATYCPTTNIELLVSSINPSYAQATAYNWSGPNGFSSTLSNPLISNSTTANSGVYTLTVTFGGACAGTSTATLNITVGNPSFNALARRTGQGNTYSFCTGTNVEFFTNINPSDAQVSSYTWSGPNGFSSTLATPQIANWQSVNAGIYTLSISFSGVCAGNYTSTVNLSVGNPFVFISSNPSTTQCPGGSITMRAFENNTSFGTGTTYSWSGPNSFSSTVSNPTLSNLQSSNSGTYTVTVNYPFTSGCATAGTATATTTLNIGVPTTFIRTRIQGSQSYSGQFCTGNNIELSTAYNITNPAPTVASYSWSGPNNFSSTSATPLINNLQSANSGVYSVTVVFSGACAGTATSTLSLSISIPYIFADSYTVGGTPVSSSSFCPTSTVELRGTPYNHFLSTVSYSWVGPNNFTSTAQNPQISSLSTTNAGTYTLTGTFTGACIGTSTYTKTITVGSPTVLVLARRSGQGSNAYTFCAGSNIELYTSINPSSTPVNSYTWSGPNGFSSTLATPQMINWQANNVGVYSLSITFGGNCAGTFTSTVSLTLGNPSVFISANSSTAQCSGGSITLSAFGNNTSFGTGTTYNWSGPNSFSSTISNPTIPNLQTSNSGTYTVTVNYPFTSGCATAGTTTATATLNIGPPLTSIRTRIQGSQSYSSQFCIGNDIELSTAYSISNPTPTVASYSWSGPNSFSSTSATPLINSLQSANAGVYSVTVVFNGACAGTATSTLSLFINVPFLFVDSYTVGGTPVSSTSFCPTSAVELRGTPFNHNSSTVNYSWVGPNNFTSTAQNPQISNLSTANAGTYTLTGTFSGACVATSTATRTITVGSPTVFAYARRVGQGNNAFTFCTGSNIELYSSIGSSNGQVNSYNWSGPNGFSSTLATPQITNVQSINQGVYSLTITLGGSCAATLTATSNITIGNVQLFAGVAGSSIQCPGGSTSLFVSTNMGSFGSGTTYSWTGPNGFSSTSQFTQTISNLQSINSGIYTVTVNYPNTSGCVSSGLATITTRLAIGNTGANILPNQDQTVTAGLVFPLSVEFLGGTAPFNITFSNGSSFSNLYPSNPYTFNLSVNTSSTITITSISSSCGVGTGTGSAAITIGTPCPPNLLNYSGTFNNGMITFKESSGDITTQSITLNSGGKLSLDSGKSITLNPGFVANTGSVFRAFIDGCGNITNAPTPPPK